MSGRFPSLKHLGLLLGVLISVVYLFLASKVTFISFDSNQLEPDVEYGQLLLIRHGHPASLGGLLAFETEDGPMIQRILSAGSGTVSCVRDHAIIDGRLIEAKRSKGSEAGGDAVVSVRERWGAVEINILKRQRLLPYPLPTNQPKLILSAQHTLVGCQNRVACNGCGFRKVEAATIIGSAEPLDSLFQWDWLGVLFD